jgi:hypothetical protein
LRGGMQILALFKYMCYNILVIKFFKKIGKFDFGSGFVILACWHSANIRIVNPHTGVEFMKKTGFIFGSRLYSVTDLEVWINHESDGPESTHVVGNMENLEPVFVGTEDECKKFVREEQEESPLLASK